MIKVAFIKYPVNSPKDAPSINVERADLIEIPEGNFTHVKITRPDNHSKMWDAVMGKPMPIKKDYDKILGMDVERRLRLKGYNVTNFIR